MELFHPGAQRFITKKLQSPISEMRSVTCHMISQCYLPSAITPARQPVLDLPTAAGWKA